MNLYFEHVERLWLLLVPVLWAIWYIFYYDRRRLTLYLSYHPGELMALPRHWSYLRFLVPGLQTLALMLLVFALARPRSVDGVLPKERRGIDILLLLDISASMETSDLTPTRLRVAKRLLVDLVRSRPDDAFGLVLFSQEAFSYIPLTSDHNFVQKQLQELTTDLIPKEGTALGNAIAAGTNRLRDSKSKGRVMILLTDGVHNVGAFDPINAAQTAARNNLRIYTIGVGSVVTLPAPNIYVHGDTTDFDEATLRQIAQITDGKYYHANNEQALESILLQISRRETITEEAIVYNRMFDRYHIFVAGALGCLLLAFGLARMRWINFLEG